PVRRRALAGAGRRMSIDAGMEAATGHRGFFLHDVFARIIIPEAHLVRPNLRWELRFRLLHEEDLMRFFRILSRHGSGVFTIDECRLRRLETRGVIRFQPNVLAECELSWITAKVPRPGEPK
ncbi:MAG: hypothetical protein K6U89_19690, partial [Chloroflexi bacterium]|nr:hypothetical protein [Chloroflexota bacterium]